jgi:Arc/MetJ family transcription regulator
MGMKTDICSAGTATVSDLDGGVPADAQRALESESPTETVNQALREAVRRRLATKYVDYLRGRGD